MTTRMLVGLLAATSLFCACRIRRERPQVQPAPQPFAEPVSSAGASPAPSVVASIAPEPIPPPTERQASVPVAAPPGVLVVAATSADVRSTSIESALNSVRMATRQLLDANSGIAATVSGLVSFERIVEVPVASGAPQRRNGARPQCDVVLLDSTGRLSGVGAVTDLESPARLAAAVHERGWGFVVGNGAQDLAAEVRITSQHWSTEVAVPPSSELDAGNALPQIDKDDPVANARERGRIDAGAAGVEGDAGLARPPADRPSVAILMLRDREGRFFVAAEDCGRKGDPSGQLTSIAATGTALFVGDEGAVFVGGTRELSLEARHADRIYRRLLMLQAPKVVADWGLRTSEGASMVIVVSRIGSAIASQEPVVWARNHADGESSATLPSATNMDVQPETAATRQSGAEGTQSVGAPQVESPIDASAPRKDRASQIQQQRRSASTISGKAAPLSGVAPGSSIAAGGRSTRLPEQDAGPS